MASLDGRFNSRQPRRTLWHLFSDQRGRVFGAVLAAGVVEIAAGIGVALKPRIFSYVVAVWLWAIIVNLLLIPGFFDVALRDFGLSLGALALGRLSSEHGRA